MKYLCIILVEKMSSAFGSFAPDRHRGAAPGPRWGTSVLQTPSLPTPGKNPAAPMVLFTNKKSHTWFRLVPKSVTLNDLERRNDRRCALSLRCSTVRDARCNCSIHDTTRHDNRYTPPSRQSRNRSVTFPRDGCDLPS